MFIHLLEDWNLCMHNNEPHGKDDSLVQDLAKTKKINDILIHDYRKARWIGLCLEDDTGLTQVFSFYDPVFPSANDWCDEEFNILPTYISLSPAEEKWSEKKL